MAKLVIPTLTARRRSARLHGTGFIEGGPDTGPPSGLRKHNSGAAGRVHLFVQDTLRPVETLVTADGYFRFDGLNPALPFFVVAFDPERSFNAVIADRLTPSEAS